MGKPFRMKPQEKTEARAGGNREGGREERGTCGRERRAVEDERRCPVVERGGGGGDYRERDVPG